MDVPRISGHLMPNYINKKIILLGTINKKSSDGRSAELRTPDGVHVNISLGEPIDGNEEGYVEVQGTVKSKNTLACTRMSYTMVDDDFDSKQYIDMVNMYHLFGETVYEEFNEKVVHQATNANEEGS